MTSQQKESLSFNQREIFEPGEFNASEILEYSFEIIFVHSSFAINRYS